MTALIEVVVSERYGVMIKLTDSDGSVQTDHIVRGERRTIEAAPANVDRVAGFATKMDVDLNFLDGKPEKVT